MKNANRGELELKLVGALLSRSDTLYELPAGFSDAMFSQMVLGRVWRAIERQAKLGKLDRSGALDPAAVCTWADLSRDEHRILLDTAVDLARGCSVPQVAAALQDQHRRSGTIELLTRALDGCREGTPTEDVLASISTGILDLDRSERPETISFRDAALKSLDATADLKKGPGAIKSGLSDLDRLVKLRGGKLLVLAARPKVGKSTLALQIATTIAAAGRRVLVHSLEMEDAELVSVALSRLAHINSEWFTDDADQSDQWSKVAEAVEVQCNGGDGNLDFNSDYFELNAICRITEKLHRRSIAETGKGLALVVVDYLQLVVCRLVKNATRENQVSFVARSLKQLAKRIGVPVLALAQLNRASVIRGQAKGSRKSPDEDDTIPAPQLHDLRESGAIEQDANCVMFLHNPYGESEDDFKRLHGPFRLIVAAQRMGRKGEVSLFGDLEYSQFKQIARGEHK